MKPASAKNKGRQFQKLISESLQRLFWRELDDEDIGWCSMGAGGEDILLSPLARKHMPISIECKHRKSFAIYSILDQAKANAGGYAPVAAIKGDRKKPLAVIEWEFFEDLLYAYSQSKADEEHYLDGEDHENKRMDMASTMCKKFMHADGLDQEMLLEIADEYRVPADKLEELLDGN